jgi:hypothetical protein
MGPMMAGPVGGAAGGADTHDPTRSIVVVVPYTNDISVKHPFYTKTASGQPLGFHQYNNPAWELAVRHPYGYANLLYDNTQIQVYTELGPGAPKGKKSRQAEVTDKHLKWKRNPTEPQLLLDLITDALEAGMVDEAVTWSDDLLTLVADKEKRLKTTPQVERFVKAYTQLQKPLKGAARSASDGAVWKDRWLALAYPNAHEAISAHYYLIYWDAPDAERTRRITQLEENFKAFFLLNALHGVALTVPDRPLVVILAKSGRDAVKLAAALDGTPRVADAFYAPDHGVVVLSPERLDGVGQTFQKQVQQIYREGVSRKDLLAGFGPRVDTSGTVEGAKKPDDVARMMTWALVERYAEEEAEWAGVSREATRQLLHATGLLPRHVVLPRWLSEGSAEFYERPKGPAFFTQGDENKPYVTVALATGYGGPNYARQKQFSLLSRQKELNADGGQLLRNVVTDAYFAAAREGLDADDPKLPRPPEHKVKPGSAPPPPEDPEVVRRRRSEFLANKALATSWSLYYYLAKHHADGLDRYFAELGKLPRDLPLDEPTRLKAFADAFSLTTGPTPVAGRKTFGEFAAGWLQTMQVLPAAGLDIALHDLSEGSPANPGNGSPNISPSSPPGVRRPGTVGGP